MKKFILAVLMVLSASVLHAQNYGFDVFFRGGAGVPESPTTYSRQWLTGPFVSTGFEFTLSPTVSVGVLGEYMRNTINKGAAAETVTPDALLSDGVKDVYSFAVFIDNRLAGRVGGTFPYLLLDAGVTHVRASDQTILDAGATVAVPNTSENAFRFATGLGLDVPLSANVCFSVTGKYVYLFTKNAATGYIPVDAGFKMVF